MNHIHERAAIWFLPIIVKNTFASTLNSCMSAAMYITPVVALDNIVEVVREKKLLRSNPVVIDYILKIFSNDETVAEMYSLMVRYTKSANMSQMQYGDDLYANSCKVTDFNNDATIKNILIDGVHSSICPNVHKYLATHPHVDTISNAFKGRSELAVQKCSVKLASTGNDPVQLKPLA